MDTSPRLLLVEDNPDDVVLIRMYLNDAFDSPAIRHVERLKPALQLLASEEFDIVLLDLGLPDATGRLDAFEKAHAQNPSVPVIVLTGLNDHDIAIEALQKGAQDYLVKDEMNANMLGRSIRYSIERQKLLLRLELSAKEIKTLRGFLPICANCKKIRDDRGYWTQIESYIRDHSEAEFSHSICPECAQKLYGALLNKKE